MRDQRPRSSVSLLLALAGLGSLSVFADPPTGNPPPAPHPPITAPPKPVSADQAWSAFEDVSKNGAATDFSGDQFRLGHMALRNKPNFIKSLPGGKVPEPTLKADLVIVGGGLSGLIAAHNLKDLKPIIIDPGSSFGGNAKSEVVDGVPYAIGSAYLSDIDENPAMKKLLGEVGLQGAIKERDPGDDPVFVDGKKIEHIWDNGSSAANKAQFNRIKQVALDMLSGKTAFPEIPPHTPEEKAFLHKLDQLTVRQYFEQVLGEKLDPTLERVLNAYFSSSMSGTIDELSAGAGMNFFAGDFKKITVLQGGNAKLAEALLKDLKASGLPAENLRLQEVAFDVRANEHGALVSSVNEQGKVTTIAAKAVIVTAPKPFVPFLIDDLDADRKTAMMRVENRAYLVANARLKTHIPNSDYDVYFVNSHAQPTKLAEAASTDVVMNDYVNEGAKKTILTLYRPLPFRSGRRELLMSPYEDVKKQFQTELESTILPSLGTTAANLEDLRVTRWGHPICVPLKGSYDDANAEKLRAPYKGRVFFINQDNWNLPAVESLLSEANSWSPKVHEAVRGLASAAAANCGVLQQL